jgi:sugar phosphate isomerase/epimerase
MEGHMYLGAPVWVLDSHIPITDAIETLADCGLKGCELIISDEESIKRQYTKEQCRAYRDLIADKNMILSEFVVPAGASSSEDPDERTKAIDIFKRSVDVAAEIGTKNINICCPYPFNVNFPELKTLPSAAVFTMGGADMNRDWEGNYGIFIEMIRSFCDIASGYDCNVLIEPHPYRWVKDTDTFLRLYEKAGRANLGINYDTNHCFACGDMPQHAPYRLREHMPHCHCSDNDGLFNAHWRPGKGKIDWRGFFKALADIRYTGCCSLEIGGSVPESYPKSYLIKELKESIGFFNELCDEFGIQLDI